MTKARNLKVLIAILALGAVLATVALAASPRPGTFVGNQGQQFDVIKTNNGKRVTNIIGGFTYKCHGFPLGIRQRLVIRNSRFEFDGPVKDVRGKPAGTLLFKGRFVNRRRAQGVFRHRKGNCSTGRTGYAANWQPSG